MNRNCEKLNQQLLDKGYKSQIIKKDLVEFDYGDKSLKKCYAKFDNNWVYVLTIFLISDLLADDCSKSNLAYVLSKVTPYSECGIEIDIPGESLHIYIIYPLDKFSSSMSAFDMAIIPIMYCSLNYGEIVDRVRGMNP